MKPLRLISTVVLSCLVLVAPATAAESSIHLSLPENAYLGSAVTATVAVSGEAGATRKYGVAFLHTETPVTNCGKAIETGSSSVTNVVSKTISSSSTLEESVSLPTTLYEALGTYIICVYVQRNEPTPAEAHALFVVINPPPPITVPVVSSTPAPIVTLPPPVTLLTPAVKPVVKPVLKIVKALKLCKKLKKHSKRVKCEHAAKKAAHRR